MLAPPAHLPSPWRPKGGFQNRRAGPTGDDVLCQVTGWSSSGPCQGYAVLVADSGEGAVTLIYGGDQGVRLKPMDNHDAWDLANPDQWGEPCLLLDPDVETG